jgi:hypothetical protein
VRHSKIIRLASIVRKHKLYCTFSILSSSVRASRVSTRSKDATSSASVVSAMVADSKQTLQSSIGEAASHEDCSRAQTLNVFVYVYVYRMEHSVLNEYDLVIPSVI